MSMTSHPVAFGTIEHTERAGELLGLLWQEVLRLQCDMKDVRAELQYARDGLTKGRTRMREDIERLTLELKEARESAERQTLEDAARIQALAREAHTWWTAARDATVAERDRCATRVALHSQYPIETDYDRGYDKARKDAAETLRTMGDDAGLELGPNVRAKLPAEAGAVSPVCEDGGTPTHRAYSACRSGSA